MLVNPLTNPNWDDQLREHPEATFFHTAAWARVLHEAYRYTPLYFTTAKDGKLKTLAALMEVNSRLTGKRGVSLPFTDFCPLITPANGSFRETLTKIVDHGKKAGWKYIQFRDHSAHFAGQTASATYLTHNLDLTPGEEALLRSFRSSTRRNIKKAEKAHMRVEISNSLESLKAFCRLNCLTRKRHGLPPQPWRFFKKLHEHVISKGKGMLTLAHAQNRVVAAAVYLHFGKAALYKYGASDIKYQHLRANNLLMWEAIKWFARNGFETFNFGRTEPDHRGLLQFKRGWGTTEETRHYFTYDLAAMRFVAPKAAPSNGYRTFRSMPPPLLRLVGTILYRHAA